jgi:hypothetical protein
LHNDDLPDYETINKDSRVKDVNLPTYNFVATHPTDFGIESQVPTPSAPPKYHSRRSSVATIAPDTDVVP